MFGLGTPELIVILVIILVIFGGSQLPKLARSISTSMKELRGGLTDPQDAAKKADEKNSTEDKKS